MWTPRRKRPVYRFFAHLLARLLVITPMPAECQVWAAFFPLSLVWSLSPPTPAEAGSGAGAENGGSAPAVDPAPPLSERREGVSCATREGVGVERIVSLADPAQPRVAGIIQGIAGRLALSPDGLLFGSAYSRFGGADVQLGGVRTAALGSLAYFRRVTPEIFALKEGKGTVPVTMEVGLVPGTYEVGTAEVDVLREGEVVATLPVTFNSPGMSILAAGFPFNLDQKWEVQTVINRGQADRQLVSNRKALRPAEVEFTQTAEVDDSGPLDVVKVFDPRPLVTIDVFQLEALAPVGGRVQVSGTVKDALAPVTKVLVGPTEVAVTQTGTGPEGLGPFTGTFSGSVLHFDQDQLVTVTAINALGNVGWDSGWVNTNPTVDGEPQTYASARPSVPANEANAATYSFRFEVKDPSQVSAATWLLARVNTGIEEKLVRLDREGNVFRSRSLYLVPESFAVPTGLASDLAKKLAETRLKGRLGTRPRVSYVSEEVKDEAIASGVVLVGEDDQVLKFVPGAVATPDVAITSLFVNWSDRVAVVSGSVKDPVAKTFSDLTPKVTINGQTPALSGGTGGVFTFSVTVPVPTALTHVQARAENATGAFSSDGRFVTLTEDASGNVNGSTVDGETPLRLPSSVKPIRVKVFGPKVSPAAVTGTLEGVYSLFPAGGVPAGRALQFEEEDEGRSDGVHVYVSKERVLPAKLPAHDLRVPTTPGGLGTLPLLAVEVAGLVDATVDLGPAGPLSGLTDVSGFEVVAPRDGTVLNVVRALEVSGQNPLLTVTLKWRGIGSSPSLTLALPGLIGSGEGLYSVGLPSFQTAPQQSVAVSAKINAGFEENLLVGSANDVSGNGFRTEVGLFTFLPEMVANESILGVTFRDPGGLQIGPGRFYLPAVVDGLDLLYPARSDVEISDHLQKAGLRPIAMKRNVGTLVTVYRNDGRDALAEGLFPEVPNGYAVPGARPRPRMDEPVDGDDLLFRDIVEAELENEWEGTYDLGLVVPPFDVYKRSDVIQRVRRRNGLPLSEDGRSVEYQQAIDAANRDIGMTFAGIVLPYFFRPLGVLFGAGRGFFVSAADGAIVEVVDVGVGGAVQLDKIAVPAADRILPTLTRLSDHLLPFGSQPAGALATQYRSLQVMQRGGWANEALTSTIGDQLVDVSLQLGVFGARSVVQESLGIDLGTRICCDGAGRGGGATGKFDEVFVQGDRIVIIEAKGGLGYRNPLAKKAGRKVAVGGAEKFAFQGTKEYLERTVALMIANSDPQISAAGRAIRGKLDSEGFAKVEYYITSTRWAGRLQRGAGKGLAAGVSRVVRIYKAVF